jgi:hypothetical protein
LRSRSWIGSPGWELRALTPDDRKLIGFARQIVDANTDGEYGVRSVRITDLMPLGAVWTPAEGTQDFDPELFR